MVIDIPAQFQTGEYFLIVCADVMNYLSPGELRRGVRAGVVTVMGRLPGS